MTGIALFTRDADLALMPPVDSAPDIAEALRAGGFTEGKQPGIWIHEERQLDLLVPASLSPEGRRAARLPGHGRRTARRVSGIEGALVDNEIKRVFALDPDDGREAQIRVAGPAALLVSKGFKLAEREQEADERRLHDKDASDAYRLLQLPTQTLAAGFGRMQEDAASMAVATTGLAHIRRLFDSPDAAGSAMAGRSVEGVGNPETVRLSASALCSELLDALDDVGSG